MKHLLFVFILIGLSTHAQTYTYGTQDIYIHTDNSSNSDAYFIFRYALWRNDSNYMAAVISSLKEDKLQLKQENNENDSIWSVKMDSLIISICAKNAANDYYFNSHTGYYMTWEDIYRMTNAPLDTFEIKTTHEATCKKLYQDLMKRKANIPKTYTEFVRYYHLKP